MRPMTPPELGRWRGENDRDLFHSSLAQTRTGDALKEFNRNSGSMMHKYSRPMKSLSTVLSLVFCMMAAAPIAGAAQIKVLIIDGQNNHDWKATTPVLRKMLEDSGLFEVTVATSPGAGKDMSSFRPDFARHQVVVSNYNGDRWATETEKAFVEFVRDGGGFVPVHAANNSFPDWPEYNEMIGIGGWGNRNEKSGPYIRLRGEQFVLDPSPGVGGSHGKQHAFLVETRDPTHPIMQGLPKKWLHVQDELYDRLRGPAKDVQVLATAFSSKETNGSGEHEPMLMTVRFGKGRIFHTTLGHSVGAMKCVGFVTTLLRGTEWAGSGKVTQPVPDDFPTADNTRSRP